MTMTEGIRLHATHENPAHDYAEGQGEQGPPPRHHSQPRSHPVGGPDHAPIVAILGAEFKFPANAASHPRTLGRGAFSKVKLAIYRATGEPVAVKIVNKLEMEAKAARAREHRARAKAREEQKKLEAEHVPSHTEPTPTSKSPTRTMTAPQLPDLVRHLLPEPQLLLLLSHRNVVRLLAVAESPAWCFCAMEYLPNGDLSSIVPPRAPFGPGEAKVRNYFRQLLLALHHAHSKGVVHRDLKPENVMLADWRDGEHGTGTSDRPVFAGSDERQPGQDEEGCWRLVVADFGLGRGRWRGWGTRDREAGNLEESEELEDTMRTFCGTPNFASPELVSGLPYDATLSDAWALGVLLYQLLHPNGALPFTSPNSLSHLYTLIKACHPEYASIPSGAVDLLKGIFVRDPSVRTTVEDMMRDPWVCQGGWESGQLALENQPHEDPSQIAKQLVGVRNAGHDGEFVVCTVGHVGSDRSNHPSSGSFDEEEEQVYEDHQPSNLGWKAPHDMLSRSHLPLSRRGSLASADEIASTLSHDVLGAGGVVGLSEPRFRRKSTLFDDTHIVLDPGESTAPISRRLSWQASTLPAIGETSAPAVLARRLSESGKVDYRPIRARRNSALSDVDEVASPQSTTTEADTPSSARDDVAGIPSDPITVFHTLHRPASRIRRISFPALGQTIRDVNAETEERTFYSCSIEGQAPVLFQVVHSAICEAGGEWQCSRPDPDIYCLRVDQKVPQPNERLEVEIFERVGLVGTLLSGLSLPTLSKKRFVVRCRIWVGKQGENKGGDWIALATKITRKVEEFQGLFVPQTP